MADILTLKEVELDYEAEEADEGRGEDGTPTPRPGDIPSSSPRTDGVISREDGLLSSPLKVKRYFIYVLYSRGTPLHFAYCFIALF